MSVADIENYRKRLQGEVPNEERESHNRDALAMLEPALDAMGVQYGTILLPRDLVNNQKLKSELLKKLPANFPFAYVNLDELLKILENRKVKI